jgi:hypothetical protein
MREQTRLERCAVGGDKKKCIVEVIGGETISLAWLARLPPHWLMVHVLFVLARVASYLSSFIFRYVRGSLVVI